jgi:serine/threonine-protein kinase
MQNPDLASFPIASQLGRVLFGRFRIDSLIATGSMGAVFSAWDSERQEPCAVKLLLPTDKKQQQQMVNQRFVDEARLISQLCHPNIVEVWNHYEEPDGTLYLVMELLRGQDLYTVLRTQGSLPLPQVLQIVKQVGSALHTVHLAGMVHRDIKPKNIILLDDSESPGAASVKVIDFGLAKLSDQRRAPRRGSDGMLIGTPGYLPPEALSGISADVDGRADQWALAVVTYLMLSGRLPHEPDDSGVPRLDLVLVPPPPLGSLVAQLPPHIESAVARALAPDKSQRFPTVLDFVRALHNLPPAAPSCRGVPLFQVNHAEPTQLLVPALSARPTQPSSSHLETLVAAALAPSLTPTATVVSQGAGSVTPVVSPLDTTAPLLSAVPRRRLGPYVSPAISILGAVLAWCGVLWSHPLVRPPAASPPAACQSR